MTDSLKFALCAVGGFLLGLTVGSIWRPVPPDVAQWEARVVRYQKDSADFERAIAVLHGQRARLEDSARTLATERAVLVSQADEAKRRARDARRMADSAVANLDSAKTAADSVPVLVAALTARTEEANQAHAEADTLRSALGNAVAESLVLRGVITTQDSVIATVTNRLRIADDLLRDRPQTDRCRVLWFNCPSRTTTFIVGAVLGAAGGLYVATGR